MKTTKEQFQEYVDDIPISLSENQIKWMKAGWIAAQITILKQEGYTQDEINEWLEDFGVEYETTT